MMAAKFLVSTVGRMPLVGIAQSTDRAGWGWARAEAVLDIMNVRCLFDIQAWMFKKQINI